MGSSLELVRLSVFPELLPHQSKAGCGANCGEICSADSDGSAHTHSQFKFSRLPRAFLQVTAPRTELTAPVLQDPIAVARILGPEGTELKK